MIRFSAILAAALIATGAIAQDAPQIVDPYARAASPMAKAGGVFMEITAPADDRLVAAESPAATRVELHTHIQDAEGVMRMVEIEDGIELPAGETVILRRGGMHVMLMGLTGPLEQGATVELTLSFEQAGDVTVTVPVDNERMPMKGHMGG